MIRAELWLDYNGNTLTPVEGAEMPEVDVQCHGDTDCENQPTIAIRAYIRSFGNDGFYCYKCFDRLQDGP